MTAEIDWNYTSWSRRCRKILIGLVVRGAKTVVVRGKNRILTQNREKLEMTVPISFFGGPRLSIGLFGLTNEHYYMATKPQLKDTSPFYGEPSMRAKDFSFGIGTGIELENFQFMLGYDFPLTNSVVNINPSPSVLKQHNFRFSVAYTIRSSKDKTIVR